MYMKRMENLKNEYSESSPFYKARLEALRYKIRIWKKAIQRIEAKELQINDLVDKIEAFFGFSLRNTANSQTKEVVTAKKIFSKYGMENGIKGRTLSRYLGYVDEDTASKFRKQFTRSFIEHPENKELFNRFKNYV